MTYDQWRARITQVSGDLWVSEVACRAQTEWLLAFGINAVVSILTHEQAEEWASRAPVAPAFKHTTWFYGDGDDIPPEIMDGILDSFGSRTLVHCAAGKNRSIAVALCHLMRGGLSPTTAANRLFNSRGLALAKVYLDVCGMSVAMEKNVERWMLHKVNG